MDVAYFLKMRTEFIRSYYDTAQAPFAERMRQIVGGLPPYDDPPCSEDDEPPYTSEWMDADLALQVLGRSCVSMLSESLKLYFGTLLERVIGARLSADAKKAMTREGFPTVYREVLGEIFETDWSDTPIDFDIIEQVVLARNRSQHGEHLPSFYVTHDAKTLAKYPRPFFARPEESDGFAGGILSPEVKVTRETLFAALDQADDLADWIDARGSRFSPGDGVSRK